MGESQKTTLVGALVMTEINPPERKRVYYFPGGEKVELADVTHFHARPSGTHRLRTKDGRLWIVPTGWLAVEVDADGWTL